MRRRTEKKPRYPKRVWATFSDLLRACIMDQEQKNQEVMDPHDVPMPAVDSTLAPVAPSEPVATMDRWRARNEPIFTSIDRSTLHGKLTYANALGAKSPKACDGKEAKILVRDWLLHQRQLPPLPDGEVLLVRRLVLITTDGQCFETFSGPVIDNWYYYAELGDGKPFDPPLEVTLVPVKGTKPTPYWIIDHVCLQPAETKTEAKTT